VTIGVGAHAALIVVTCRLVGFAKCGNVRRYYSMLEVRESV